MKKFTLLFTLLLFTAFNYTAQAAESHTVACTAGNLATVAASYLTTVTNLTVTGTIDARDFKTMRDDMPLLEVIDLSGSTVEGYSGTEGTGGTKSVSYPANEVPDWAFCNPSYRYGKTSLKTFIYPSSVITIGECAFRDCSGFIGSLNIPSSVATIRRQAFQDCIGFIGSLSIPSSVTTIHVGAFMGCGVLFEVDQANPNYSSIDGILFNKNKTTLVQCPKSKTGSLTIPSSVTTIGGYAFYDCSGFTGSLTISSTVTTIGEGAFMGCGVLFEVDQANPNYSSIDGILFNKNKTSLVQCPISKTGSLTIPASVTNIGYWAFYNCSGFTGSLNIPASVTTIGESAFYDCSGFTGSLTIPALVTTIGDNAFRGCSGFTGSLNIPASVTTIGYATFYDCSGLTGLLTIPSSLTTIGEYAFGNCSGLTGSLNIPSSVTTIGESAFSDCSGFTGSLNIPASATTIGKSAFYDCSGLTGSLNISASVTTIGEYAFGNCSGLTGSLTIPSSVTTIGEGAFGNCSGFTGTLNIPATVTTIGESAFYDCSGFTGSLNIPSSVTTIGESAFSDCSGFTGSLTIPASVTTIDEGAFMGCGVLFEVDQANSNYSSIDGILFNKNKTTLVQCPKSKTGSLTIPASVTTIGYGAFYNCSGLTGSLNIPASVTTIDPGAFYNCSGLTGSLNIPALVTIIGPGAFYNCRGLTGSLNIPASVTTIGNKVFWGCSGLTSIRAYSTTPINISTSLDVFYEVNKTTCILHVSVGSKSLYAAADQWKDFTNIVDDIVITSIEKVQDSGTISIYPNPANSYITVMGLGILAGNKTVTLSVVDVSGSTLLVKEVEPTINTLSIDVSAFKKGIYFITVQTSNGSIVKRFVKE